MIPRRLRARSSARRSHPISAGTPVNVYRVAFEPGARTHWHTHDGPQWLLVVEGRIRIQTLGEAPQEAVAGDAIVIPPGETHWHGATPSARGVHLAVNVKAATKWMDAVTDEQYLRCKIASSTAPPGRRSSVGRAADS